MKQPVLSGVSVALSKLINGNSYVLLGERRNTHGAGTWALPGGRIDPGEEPQNTASRELAEETGIEIPAGGLKLSYTTPYSSLIVDEQAWLTLYFYAFTDRKTQAKLLEPDKCSEWDWFPTDNLPEPLFPPAQAYLQNRKRKK